MHPAVTRESAQFVDAHVHIREGKGLDDIAAAGVTAVRDAGSREGVGLAVSRRRPNAAPAVVTAGWALVKKGGYGSLFGVPVETRDEIRSEILRLRRAGAGIIKVMASGMVSLKKTGTVTPGGFDRDDLGFIIDEAASHGLTVMAHANGERAIIAAAEAGARSIEHGFFMSERAIGVLAKERAFWVPTVTALKRAADAGGASKEAKDFVAGLIRSHLSLLRLAHESGVLLAVGTDCVLPAPSYREAYESELRYFEQAGISPDKVTGIACEGGAKLLGLDL